MTTSRLISHARMASPLGPLRIAATADGIAGIGFDQDDEAGEADVDLGSTSPVTCPLAQRWLDTARRQLDEYFAGMRRAFQLALVPEGTAFQRAVWAQLAQLPFGATTSYGAIARGLSRPTACRAIGSANGRNPIAIVVPCHRVIGSDGALTGYAGGLVRKRWLLAHERRVLARSAAQASA